MGYLLILGAALLNIVKAYSSKKLSRETECIRDNIDLSIMRNIFCVMVGALFILFTAGADFRLPWQGVIICLIAGAVMSVNYVAWVMALKSDAILFASTANNANFIVVAIFGIFVFKEELTWTRAVAMAVILLALLFMTKYQKGIGKSPKLYDFVLLLLVFLAGGASSVTEKYFTKTPALKGVSPHLYTFYAFFFAVVLLSLLRPLMKGEPERTQEATRHKLLVFLPHALVMGIAIYGVTYFKTLSNKYLDTIVLYPLNNGLTLVGSCIMAWICFKEKPNKYSLVGMALVFFALLLSSGTVDAWLGLK